MVAQVTLGGIAAIVATGFFGLLVLFLVRFLVHASRLLVSTTMLVDGVRESLVPLIKRTTTTIDAVAGTLERADGLLESVGTIAKAFARLASVFDRLVTRPLMKLIRLGATVSRMWRRLLGRA